MCEAIERLGGAKRAHASGLCGHDSFTGKPDGNANGTSRLTAGNAGNARGRRLRGAGHGQFLQVVHEDLQADVVGEDGGPRLLEPRHKHQRLKNMSGTLQHAAAPT